MADETGALCRAVEKSIAGAIGKKEMNEKIAAAFSAGLDSAIIAHVAKGKGNVILVSVGTKGSDDIAWSERFSRQFAGMHIVHILSDGEIARIRDALRAKFGFDFLSIGILIPFYKACEIAAENGCARIVSGAGAEEVFLGYKKFVDAARKGKPVSEIRREAVAFWHSPEGDGAKMRKVAEKFGLEVEAPFLAPDVISAAEEIPDARHLPRADRLSKPVLRDAARSLGVPEEICSRPKKAMQYGSGVQKALMRLRKEEGSESE